VYRIFGRARPGYDLSLRVLERVQNANNGEFACTRALLFQQEFPVDVRADERAEVRRMQLDRLFQLLDEKHGGANFVKCEVGGWCSALAVSEVASTRQRRRGERTGAGLIQSRRLYCLLIAFVTARKRAALSLAQASEKRLQPRILRTSPTVHARFLQIVLAAS